MVIIIIIIIIIMIIIIIIIIIIPRLTLIGSEHLCYHIKNLSGALFPSFVSMLTPAAFPPWPHPQSISRRTRTFTERHEHHHSRGALRLSSARGRSPLPPLAMPHPPTENTK